MKRSLFTLVLAMTLLLCACHQGTSVKKDVQEGQQKLTKVEECSLVLQLSAKPLAELYLDENWTVMKAILGKEELALAGTPYADAVDTILSEGKLDRANIQLQVLSSASGPLTREQLLQLQRAITPDEENMIPEVDQSVVVAADAGADSFTVEEMANGDIFYDYYSGGSVVRQVCYHADCSYDEWHYKGRWPNIYTTATIHVTADGIRTETYLDYDENGQQIYQMQKCSDGTLEEQTFYSDGNLKSVRLEDADGRTAETYFHPNGNPKTSEEHDPNSDNCVYGYRTYAENGVCTEEIYRFADGSTQERKYDADGRNISDQYTYPNGDWTEVTYYPSGRIQTEEGSLDGEYYINQYDENGMAVEN